MNLCSQPKRQRIDKEGSRQPTPKAEAYKDESPQPTQKVECCILTLDPAQNAIQGDAPEGSDTFQWQLGEEIAWAEIG